MDRTGRKPRAYALRYLIAPFLAGALLLLAGDAAGQNHFSVDANAAGSPNSAVNKQASPEGEIYDGQNACCTNAAYQDELAPVGIVPALGILDAGDEVDAYSHLHPAGSLPGMNAPLDYSVAPGVGAGPVGTLLRGMGVQVQFVAPSATLGLTGTDNIDAYCYQVGALPGHYFSLTAGSPSLGTISANPGDILKPGSPSAQVAVSFKQIGLVASDELDAMALWDQNNSNTLDASDDVLFSLAPGSPTLASIGAGPSDVLRSTITAGVNPNPPTIYTTAAFLGIGANVNLDALDDTDSNLLLYKLQAQGHISGPSGTSTLHTYTLIESTPGPDSIPGTTDDVDVPVPGVTINLQSLDTLVATVNPPSGLTNASGEVSTLVDFAGPGETYVEATVPTHAIIHYTQATTTDAVPVLSLRGTGLFLLMAGFGLLLRNRLSAARHSRSDRHSAPPW